MSTDTFDPYQKWLSIPPSEQPPNHYRLLGLVLFENDQETIGSAADRQMAYVRTFQTGPHGPISQQILNELAGARVCLLDPSRRAAYDEQLEAEQSSTQNSPPPVGKAVTIPPRPQVSTVVNNIPEAGIVPEADVDYDIPDDLTAGGNGTATSSATRLRRRTKSNPLITIVMVAGGGISGLLLATAIMYFMKIGFWMPGLPETTTVIPATGEKIIPQTPTATDLAADENEFVNDGGSTATDSISGDDAPEQPVETAGSDTEKLLAEARQEIARRRLKEAEERLVEYMSAPDVESPDVAERLVSEIKMARSDSAAIHFGYEAIQKKDAGTVDLIAAGQVQLRTQPPIEDPVLKQMFQESIQRNLSKIVERYRKEHLPAKEENPFQEVNPFQPVDPPKDEPKEENPFG